MLEVYNLRMIAGNGGDLMRIYRVEEDVEERKEGNGSRNVWNTPLWLNSMHKVFGIFPLLSPPICNVISALSLNWCPKFKVACGLIP